MSDKQEIKPRRFAVSRIFEAYSVPKLWSGLLETLAVTTPIAGLIWLVAQAAKIIVGLI